MTEELVAQYLPNLSRHHEHKSDSHEHDGACLLYTSDAADERSSVDLGGRRIIKQKNNKKKYIKHTSVSNQLSIHDHSTDRRDHS